MSYETASVTAFKNGIMIAGVMVWWAASFMQVFDQIHRMGRSLSDFTAFGVAVYLPGYLTHIAVQLLPRVRAVLPATVKDREEGDGS